MSEASGCSTYRCKHHKTVRVSACIPSLAQNKQPCTNLPNRHPAPALRVAAIGSSSHCGSTSKKGAAVRKPGMKYMCVCLEAKGLFKCKLGANNPIMPCRMARALETPTCQRSRQWKTSLSQLYSPILPCQRRLHKEKESQHTLRQAGFKLGFTWPKTLSSSTQLTPGFPLPTKSACGLPRIQFWLRCQTQSNNRGTFDPVRLSA